jgi:hypothetical protein
LTTRSRAALLLTLLLLLLGAFSWLSTSQAQTRIRASQINLSDVFAFTGANTHSNTETFSGALVSSAIGPTSGQQHTLPAVASDTVVLLAATQSPTNKTFGATNSVLVAALNGGSGASSTTYWRGDGTWQPASGVTEATWASAQPSSPGAGATAKAYAETIFPSGHTLIRFVGFLGGTITTCATTTPVVSFYDETAAAAVASLAITNTGSQLYDSGVISVAMTAGHTFSMRITTAGDGACQAGNPAIWTAVYK